MSLKVNQGENLALETEANRIMQAAGEYISMEPAMNDALLPTVEMTPNGLEQCVVPIDAVLRSFQHEHPAGGRYCRG